MRAAASRTFCTAGSSNPMRIAMMAITTSNSISVNAIRRPRVMARLRNPGGNETGREQSRANSVLNSRRTIDTDRQSLALLGPRHRLEGVVLLQGELEGVGHLRHVVAPGRPPDHVPGLLPAEVPFQFSHVRVGDRGRVR